ncbi:MAG: class II aldolase [Oxalobacter sp.]|nr:MAG: class II aldolase [Oxalobacter sp.]
MNRPEEHSHRQSMLAAARQLVARGLNRGTSGNISVRCNDGLLLTPSGVSVDALTSDMMVKLDFEGNARVAINNTKPSSEWRMHRDILAARPDVGAVVHTHATFATTLACLHRDIPPFHYMIALAGGDSIRCAPYALFGSQTLSDHALTALTDRYACLLAQHGMIALGRDLDHALAIAEEVESLCEQYWRVLQIGEPKLLSPAQMADVLEQFKTYGQWKRHE